MWFHRARRHLRGPHFLAGLAAFVFASSGPARVHAQASTAAPSGPAEVAPRPGPRQIVAPAGAGQRALGVELAHDGLAYRVCSNTPCSARGGHRLELPPEALAAATNGELQVIEIAPGRRVVHVRIPLANGAWEALVAAGLDTPEASIIFAGLTGPLEGEDGQRSGAMLWLRDDEKGTRVLVGRVQEDVQLCGRSTLLEPQLLGADLTLKHAKVQQLPLEERRSARVLDVVRAASGPTPGGNGLRAVVASSALGNPGALTDGRLDTTWSEARGGEGRGEFVVLRPLSTLVSLELLVRPEGEAPPHGAAPRSVWLVTRSSVYRIDWAEDAWQAPGVWYTVRLPEPLTGDCAALVLEQAYTEAPETQVTLAELRGVSELQLLAPAELVGRLSTPGDVGAAAVPALIQAGAAGVDAVVGAFAALDAVGRGRALDVLEDAPCEATAGAYVDLLDDEDERHRRRAEQRLRTCGGAAREDLRRAFEASSGDAAIRLAEALANIEPALAVELLGPRLAVAAVEHRSGYRDALSRASRHADAAPGVRRLLALKGLGVAAEIDLLRALGDRVLSFRPEASLAFGRAAAASRSFEHRFLLLGPAARLALADPAAAAFVKAALSDPDPYLRAAAARLAPDVPALHVPLVSATRDEGVRVREASALRLGELSVPAAATALAERLREDRWPLVRAAAARSLVTAPPGATADKALAAALRDESPRVRGLSLRALGQRGARSELAAIAERFRDPEEQPEVRGAAARALGELCDMSVVDELTQAASRLLAARPSPADMSLGNAALGALGRLHPPDLDRRLAPLFAAKGRPEVEFIVNRAPESQKRCEARPPGN